MSSGSRTSSSRCREMRLCTRYTLEGTIYTLQVNKVNGKRLQLLVIMMVQHNVQSWVSMPRRKRRCAETHDGPRKRAYSAPSINFTSSSSLSTGFFDLPREIRDQIYHYALVTNNPISVLNLTTTRCHHIPSQALGISPALLAVSKRVHGETIDVLYGLNTFYFSLDLDLAQAQQRHRISHALNTLRLSPDFEPPIPDVVCVTDRPRYLHPRLISVKRLELELNVVIPSRPPWREPLTHGVAWTDYRFGDICRFLVERGRLELLVLTTAGCGEITDWHAAGAQIEGFAKHMHLTMSFFHEWHLERALLAAQRQRCAFWVHRKGSGQIHQHLTHPEFNANMRALTDALRNQRQSTVNRQPPTRFFSTGQLRTRHWNVVRPGDVTQGVVAHKKIR